MYALPERGRRPWAAAAWFAAAALCKETAIVVPLTLAVVDGVEAWRARPKGDVGVDSHPSDKNRYVARIDVYKRQCCA